MESKDGLLDSSNLLEFSLRSEELDLENFWKLAVSFEEEVALD